METLKEIVNIRSFNFLTLPERDSLLPYLSVVDRSNPEAIDEMFCSNAFLSNIPLYQTLLQAGEFEEMNDNGFIFGDAFGSSEGDIRLHELTDGNSGKPMVHKNNAVVGDSFSNNDFLQYLKSKKKRDHVDPWKVNKAPLVTLSSSLNSSMFLWPCAAMFHYVMYTILYTLRSP